MNLPAELFSEGWHWLAAIISLTTGLVLVRGTDWRALGEGPQLNLMFGLAVTLALIWSLKAGVKPGLSLHLLGAMAATLVLGPRLALVSLGLALCGVSLNGDVGWHAWPINFVLMCLIPVLIAHGFLRFVERMLPPHFFIFIFVVAFFGSAFTIVSGGFISSLAMSVAGAYRFEYLASEYLPYFILIGFSEAWIGGALITVLVVYRPEWVAAFDDRKYLLGK